MFDPRTQKNFRFSFQKLLIVNDQAIFFLQEKTKFIGIHVSFGREICKNNFKNYLVRKIRKLWILKF